MRAWARARMSGHNIASRHKWAQWCKSAQGHKQVQGGESGYKDTSWWKQAQADTNNPLSSSPPLRVQEYEYASSLTSLYPLMPLCLCACLCPCVYLHLLVPLCLHAPACTLVPTCTIVPTHTHSHPSYPVKHSLLCISHQPPSILPTTPPNKHKWAQARAWADRSSHEQMF